MAIVVRGGAEKWRQRTQAAAGDYGSGVANPRRSWAAATQAATATYAAGVQAAIANNSFGKGVARAGDAKYQEAVRSKGVQRFAAGVNGSGSAYQDGFAPYAATIAGLSLPDRGPRGDPGNIERVRVVTTALHDKKVQLQGQGGR